MSLLAELKRRKVVQVAAVYALTAWLLVQVVVAIEAPLSLPDWADTLVIVLLAVGFPVALILSWVFDLTPEGVKPATKPDPTAAQAATSAARFSYVAQGLVLLAVGFLVVDQYFLDDVRQRGAQADPVRVPRGVTRFAFDLSNDASLSPSRQLVALTPTGRHLAYATENGLQVRSMSELEPRALIGRNPNINTLFSSPDGQEVAFWDGATQQLKRMSISGGAAAVIAGDVREPFGASWADDGSIWFAEPEGIFRVPAEGRIAPELVIPAPADLRYYGPQLLPGGETVLFSVSPPGDWDAGEIVVQSLATGERRRLAAGGTSARYVPSGHVVYALDDRLFALPFDPESSSTSRRAVPIVNGVMRGHAVWQTGVAHYDVSDDGTLVYLSGNLRGPSTLVWVDRTARETPIPVEPRDYSTPRISPDGTRAVVSETNIENDIWIWDFENETMTRLILGRGGGDLPVWSTDGSRIAYHPGVGAFIDWRPANNTGSPERLISGLEGALDPFHPEDFSPSGALLVFHGQASSATAWDIGMAGTDGSGEPTWLLTGAFDEIGADISPDGRWIAYQSNESGRFEIYVRPFPNVDDNRWLVSNRGGRWPAWSRDGLELFYLEPGDPPQIIMIDVSFADGEAAFNERVPLFDWQYIPANLYRNLSRPYDVSPDGQRFLALKPVSRGEADLRIIVVENWFEELERLVPSN